MENNKNVLDFLSDDKNESNNLKIPKGYNNKGNKKYYCIFLVLVILIGYFVFIVIGKKDNSINQENNLQNYNSNYEEILNYKINTTLTNNFLVNTIVNIHFKESVEKVTFKIPSYYKGITTDILETNMQNDDMRAFIYNGDDEKYKYIEFENITDELIGNQRFEFSYSAEYSNLQLEDIEFQFLEPKDYDIPNFKISLKLDNVDYLSYKYVFSPKMNCSNYLNTITCEKDKLNKNTKVSVKFEKNKDIEEDYLNEKLIYSSSN